MTIQEWVRTEGHKNYESFSKVLKNSGEYQIVKVGYRDKKDGSEIIDRWEIINSRTGQKVRTFNFEYSISGHYMFPMDTMSIDATLDNNMLLISKGGLKSGPGIPDRKLFLLDLNTNEIIQEPIDNRAYLTMWNNKSSGIPGMMDVSDETLQELLKDGNVLLYDGRIFDSKTKKVTNFRTKQHFWNKNSLEELRMQINNDLNKGKDR